jgi:hypothetical protein
MIGPFAPSARTTLDQGRLSSSAIVDIATGYMEGFCFKSFLPLPEYSGVVMMGISLNTTVVA